MRKYEQWIGKSNDAELWEACMVTVGGRGVGGMGDGSEVGVSINIQSSLLAAKTDVRLNECGRNEGYIKRHIGEQHSSTLHVGCMPAHMCVCVQCLFICQSIPVSL